MPKNFYSLSSIFLSIYVYPYVPTNTHLCVYIFLYINAFCALTCLLNAYTISKYTITCEINKKESKKAQKRGLKGKKRAMGAAHFNRLKLKKEKKEKKKNLGMERHEEEIGQTNMSKRMGKRSPRLQDMSKRRD
jgi:hypothetical protein